MAAYTLSYVNLPERERPVALMRASAVIRVGCGRETAPSHWLMPWMLLLLLLLIVAVAAAPLKPLAADGLQPIGEFAVRGTEPNDQMC